MDTIIVRERPSWEDYFIEIVSIVRKRSACHRLQVGCILVSNNRIISAGYNGYLPGCPHESIIRDGHEMATVHAEQNAITDCARRGVSCEGCIAYITHYPCIHCLKILLAAGIRQIFYIEDYRNDPVCDILAKNVGVEIKKVRDARDARDARDERNIKETNGDNDYDCDF